MKTRTYLKTGEAAEILEVSISTARFWAYRYGLGRHIGAHLRFDEKKVRQFLKPESELTLEIAAIRERATPEET